MCVCGGGGGAFFLNHVCALIVFRTLAVSDLFLEGGDRGVISRQGIDRLVARVKLSITVMEGGKEKDKIAGN